MSPAYLLKLEKIENELEDERTLNWIQQQRTKESTTTLHTQLSYNKCYGKIRRPRNQWVTIFADDSLRTQSPFHWLVDRLVSSA